LKRKKKRKAPNHSRGNLRFLRPRGERGGGYGRKGRCGRR